MLELALNRYLEQLRDPQVSLAVSTLSSFRMKTAVPLSCFSNQTAIIAAPVLKEE